MKNVGETKMRHAEEETHRAEQVNLSEHIYLRKIKQTHSFLHPFNFLMHFQS